MNYNTQNAKIASITEKTLIVGIDVGSETHYARAFDWRNYEYSKKPFAFNNDEAGFAAFKAWMEDITEKHGKEAVIPGMEPTGHYWLNLGAYLQEQGMKPVHVNPHHVKKSKELDDNNPNKNDRKDPKTIAGLVNEGRFSYPYIPTGIYAEIRNLSNLRIQTQEEITRIKNRIARWFSIYFPEMKDVYKKPDAVSGMMVIKKAPLPCDIKELGVDGVNQVWRDAKLKGTGIKRARTLVSAAEHSIGSTEAPGSARIEIRNLLNDYEAYKNRMDDLMQEIEAKLSEIPYIDKLLEINGIGLKTVSCFIAEVVTFVVLITQSSCRSWQVMPLSQTVPANTTEKAVNQPQGKKTPRDDALYEAAISVIGKNKVFREIHDYYRTRKQNPLKKMQSVIAIACKLIRIFYTRY